MKIRNFLIAIVATAIIGMVAAPLSAQTTNGPKNLFPQYYTQGGASTTHAGMYPAPHWVPRNVGHTYYTYQPLMPHEMMYPHARNYYNYYAGRDAFYCDGCRKGGGGSGLNKTTVKWQSGCSHMGSLPFSRVPLQQLYYNYAKRRYCVGGNGALSTGRGGGCQGGDCQYDSGGYGYDSGCATGGCGGYDYGYDFGSDGSWAEKAAAATARLSDRRVNH